MNTRSARTAPVTVENLVASHAFRVASARQLIREVARQTGFSVAELAGERADRTISVARHYAMHLCSTVCGLSSTQIGKLFGDRDHTTVLHGLGAHARRLRDGEFPLKWLLPSLTPPGQEAAE